MRVHLDLIVEQLKRYFCCDVGELELALLDEFRYLFSFFSSGGVLSFIHHDFCLDATGLVCADLAVLRGDQQVSNFFFNGYYLFLCLK